jgi:hypothetical protein
VRSSRPSSRRAAARPFCRVGGGHDAGMDRGGNPQDFRPIGADEHCVDAPGDEWFERRIGRRLAEAVQTPALQIRDPQGLAGDEAFLEGAISPAAHHPDVAGEPTNTRSEAPRWIGGIELTGEDKQANVGRDDLRPNTADTRVRKLGRDAFAEVDAHRANG